MGAQWEWVICRNRRSLGITMAHHPKLWTSISVNTITLRTFIGSFLRELRSILQGNINDSHFTGRKPEAKSDSGSVAKLGHDFSLCFQLST